MDTFNELYLVNPFSKYGIWKYDTESSRKIVSVLQIVCGTMAIFATSSSVRLSYSILCIIMATVIYCQVLLAYSVFTIAPNLLLFFATLYQLAIGSFRKVKED